MSNSIRSIRASEIVLYDTYPVEFMMKEVFGFGKPLDARADAWRCPGVQSRHVGSARCQTHRRRARRRSSTRSARPSTAVSPTARLEVACGTIEAGTVRRRSASETIGVVDGRDAIVIEHVNRMAADLAPEWPIGRRDGTSLIAGRTLHRAPAHEEEEKAMAKDTKLAAEADDQPALNLSVLCGPVLGRARDPRPRVGHPPGHAWRSAAPRGPTADDGPPRSRSPSGTRPPGSRPSTPATWSSWSGGCAGASTSARRASGPGSTSRPSSSAGRATGAGSTPRSGKADEALEALG